MVTLFQTVLLILPFCGLGMSFMSHRNTFADISGFRRFVNKVPSKNNDIIGCPAPRIDPVKVKFVTVDNVKQEASYLHPDATIQDYFIYFPTGKKNEKLLEVPIGHIRTMDTIVITVGVMRAHYNGRDRDLQIGISDGTKKNMMTVHDATNYDSAPVCVVKDGKYDNARVSPTTKPSGTITITFQPYYQYMSCVTAQDDGYVNTGRFNEQLDVTKPISFLVERDDSYEDHYFRYFFIELYSY